MQAYLTLPDCREYAERTQLAVDMVRCVADLLQRLEESDAQQIDEVRQHTDNLLYTFSATLPKTAQEELRYG